MNKQAIKIKEVESLLSQKIQDIYQSQLEHQLDSVSYQLSDCRLIITLEGTITPPEKLLKKTECYSLAEKVRKAIERVIHPQIKNIIEEVLNVKVIDFLSDTTIKNDMTGAIAILEFKSNDI